MPIFLRTGLPGHGKTLLALEEYEAIRKRDNRPIFYSGIPIDKEKLPEWIELENAEKWHECPAESIIIIDEAQRVYRPRPNGGVVPPHVAALETHRHQGLDLVLITQHPGLLDSNVRKLVERHWHVVRAFGTHSVAVYIWEGARSDVNSRRTGVQGMRKMIRRYPKQVFGWYKSAEVHTVKRQIPARLILALLIPLLLAPCAWWLYKWNLDQTSGKAVRDLVGQSSPAGAGSTSLPSGAVFVKDKAAIFRTWLEDRTPRVVGLPHTQPLYDKVTEPVVAPYPAAAVVMRGECKAYTQQGTLFSMPQDLCKQIAENGFFVDWDQTRGQPARQEAVQAPQGDAAPQVKQMNVSSADRAPEARSTGQLVLGALPVDPRSGRRN